MKTNKTRNAGFTLVEIMIVVAIIGLLAAIAIPNYVKARATSQENACVNTMRQIDGAVNQYALENSLPGTTTIVSVSTITNYLGNNPVCPAGGTYTLTTVGTPVSCSLHGTASNPTSTQ